MLQTGTVKKIELNDKDPLDLYAIQVYIPGNVNNQITAYPYDLSIQKVPLIGESVVLIQGKSATSNPGMRYQTTTYYYLNPISLQKNIHSNALPGGNILLKGAKPLQSTQLRRLAFLALVVVVIPNSEMDSSNELM